MSLLPGSNPEIDPSATRTMLDWRVQVLNGILGGIFVIWLFALASGIINVIESYRLEAVRHEQPLAVAASVIAIYVAITAALAVITFYRNLSYSLRAGIFLFILYIAGAIGLILSSLSGDGRIFLFAFVILAAILFDLRISLIALGMSLLTIIVIGWLEVAAIVVVPAERQVNSVDPSAWASGGIVFLILSVAALISVTSLLRTLEHSLAGTRSTLLREQRLGRVLRTIREINQLIVREQDQDCLLKRTCEILVEGRGYSFAWIGLLNADMATLRLAASAGEGIDPAQYRQLFDCNKHVPACAAEALRQNAPFLTGRSTDEPCPTCPLLPIYQKRITLTLPLVRDNRSHGVLTVIHATPGGAFDEEETRLLAELADDIVYALGNIKAEIQRRLLVDTTAGLLAARDADALWSLAMTSVRRVLNADRAAIYLYDRANDRLSCAYAFGLSPEYIGELNRRFREAPGSRLLSTRQPVSVDDVQTDPNAAPLREWMLREGFRSYAVFPLLRSHGVYGAFVAYRDAVAPFTDADITSGQTLGHLLGLTLETIHLYSETRTKAAELGSLYAAAQDMAASLMDPRALLNALAHHITEALDATSGNIVSINEAGGTIQVLAEYYSEAACAGEEKDDLGRVYSMQEFPTIMHAMLVGEPITLHEDDVHLSNAERSQFEEYGARSMLFIPIMAHGKLFGDAEIWESRRRREFTLAEILLAQAMASHAAAIIENSQLFEELERREAHFRALTENAAEGVALLDARGRFSYITPTEEKILGYDHLKVIGQYVFDIVHPEDRHLAESAFQKSLQHPDELVMVEYRAMHADGSWRHLEVAIKNLLGEPNIKSLVGNFRDISERKRAEAEIQHHADELALAYDDTLAGWARALELRDELTEGHTRRVTDLTLQLARAMHLPEEDLTHIRRGATLHDIGKMGIPDAILHKTGPLSDEELVLMRQHPLFAYRMLSPIAFLRPALDIPFCHHEKWDGTGYPRGLAGEQIPLAARIFAIVDVWDAITSDRPYRPAWTKAKALEYMRSEAGKYFDPQVLETFLSLHLDA